MFFSGKCKVCEAEEEFEYVSSSSENIEFECGNCGGVLVSTKDGED